MKNTNLTNNRLCYAFLIELNKIKNTYKVVKEILIRSEKFNWSVPMAYFNDISIFFEHCDLIYENVFIYDFIISSEYYLVNHFVDAITMKAHVFYLNITKTKNSIKYTVDNPEHMYNIKPHNPEEFLKILLTNCVYYQQSINIEYL